MKFSSELEIMYSIESIHGPFRILRLGLWVCRLQNEKTKPALVMDIIENKMGSIISEGFSGEFAYNDFTNPQDPLRAKGPAGSVWIRSFSKRYAPITGTRLPPFPVRGFTFGIPNETEKLRSLIPSIGFYPLQIISVGHNNYQ